MIEATEEIMSLMIILGMMYAYADHAYDKTGRKIFRIGVIAGVGLAVWMAIMKNATSRASGTTIWNLRIYSISLAAFAAFVVFTIIEHIIAKKKKSTLKISAACISLSLYAAMLLFLIAPNFIAYPYTLKVAETTVFSSSYILKLSGVILAFVLTLVAAFASNRTGRKLGKSGAFLFLMIMLIINEIQEIGGLTQALLTRRIITNNHTLFVFAVFIVNHGTLFTYLVMITACVAAVVMLVRSAHVNEPYSNPAQHRKIRAKWRNIRRWSCTSLITAALAVILMTAVSSVVNAEVTMAPTEDSTIDGENVVVSFDQVSDGHLHRFGYTTDNGIQVRYIVIKKPNSTAYGVGMDCCDICGETGYYENRAGDVVCSRCNVIMNINTIGFEGGCNPKVVDYKVENNQIIIPIEQLTQYEKDFKNGRGTGSVN